jgi:hypothetical protein
MYGKLKSPYRSLSGLLLGVLLLTVCFTNVASAQGRAPSTSVLNLTGAGSPVTAVAAQPQQVSPAYRAGRQAGRADAERDLPRNPRNNRWTTRLDREEYLSGYDRGYSDVLDSQGDNTFQRDNDRPYYQRDYGRASVDIGRDNVVRWQAPATVRVYVQVDNEPMKLFAEGASGSQEAPWIQSGHVYTFVVHNQNGNEIARDRLDLRRIRR